MSVRVVLHRWEYERAVYVASRRTSANMGFKPCADYGDRRHDDRLRGDIAGAVCEQAVARVLNRYWSGHYWHKTEHDKYKALADVGRRIEVRRVTRRENSVWLRDYQVGRGLFVVAAYPEPPDFFAVEVLGWQNYDAAWELAGPARSGPHDRELDQRHLRDIRELITEGNPT